MKIFQTLLLLVAISAFGCGSPETVGPVGNWKITSFSAKAPGIPEQVIQEAQNEALSTYYNLKADSTVEIKSTFLAEGAKGTWSYNDSTKNIEIKFKFKDTESTEKYQVMSYDDTSMKWFQVIPQIGGDMTIGLSKQKDAE